MMVDDMNILTKQTGWGLSSRVNGNMGRRNAKGWLKKVMREMAENVMQRPKRPVRQALALGPARSVI